MELYEVQKLVASQSAFAALRRDGRVITWGLLVFQPGEWWVGGEEELVFVCLLVCIKEKEHYKVLDFEIFTLAFVCVVCLRICIDS